MAERVPTVALTVALIPELSQPVAGPVDPSGGGAASRPASGWALRRCTALPGRAFATDVWGRTASLSRCAELPQPGFEDLLSLADVDRLVSLQGLRTPFLKVAKDGDTVATARFTRGGGVGAAIADQVVDDQLTRLFADGATIVLQGLHRTHAPLIGFGQALASDLGHPVQINAYVTPPQSQGFSHHYDVHDVFVLQVAGEKRWIVHAPVLIHPMRDQPWTDRREQVAAAARSEPLLDIVLRPGDALYLPRGFIHAATALGGISAHLTVGIHEWTRMHLLDQLVADIRDVEGLRAPLPFGVDVGDPDSIRDEVGATISLMRAHLDRLADGDPAVRLSHRMGSAAQGATRAEPVGPMQQAHTLAGLDAGTEVRLRHGLHPRLDDSGMRCVLATSECTVGLDGADAAALRRLLAGEVVTAAELSVDHDLDVARALLRQALVVAARPPVTTGR